MEDAKNIGFTEKQKAELTEIITQQLSAFEEKHTDVYEFVRNAMTLPQFARKVPKANEVKELEKAAPKVIADSEQNKPQLIPKNNGKKERSKTASNTRDVKLPTTKQKVPEKKDPIIKTTRKEVKKTTEHRKILTKDLKKQGKLPTTGVSRNNKIPKAYNTQSSPSEKLIETRKLVEFNRKDFEFVDTASVLSPTFANKLKACAFDSKGEENKKNQITEELEEVLNKLKLCYSNSSLDEILKEKAITKEQALTLFKDLDAKVNVLEKEINDSEVKELTELKLEKSHEKVAMSSLSKPLSEDTIKGFKILLGILNRWDIALISDTNTFTEKALEYLKPHNDVLTHLREEVTKRFPLLTGEDIMKFKSLVNDIKELNDCKAIEIINKNIIHPVIETMNIDNVNGYFGLKATEYECEILKEAITKLKDVVPQELINQ